MNMQKIQPAVENPLRSQILAPLHLEWGEISIRMLLTLLF